MFSEKFCLTEKSNKEARLTTLCKNLKTHETEVEVQCCCLRTCIQTHMYTICIYICKNEYSLFYFLFLFIFLFSHPNQSFLFLLPNLPVSPYTLIILCLYRYRWPSHGHQLALLYTVAAILGTSCPVKARWGNPVGGTGLNGNKMSHRQPCSHC